MTQKNFSILIVFDIYVNFVYFLREIHIKLVKTFWEKKHQQIWVHSFPPSLSETSENILGKHPQIWQPPSLSPSLRQFTLCPISREGKILKVSAPQEILANIGLAAKYGNNVRLKH